MKISHGQNVYIGPQVSVMYRMSLQFSATCIHSFLHHVYIILICFAILISVWTYIASTSTNDTLFYYQYLSWSLVDEFSLAVIMSNTVSIKWYVVSALNKRINVRV